MVLDDIRFVPYTFDVVRSDLMVFSVIMFVFGVVSIEVWDTDFPVWGFVLALLICMFCHLCSVLFSRV